MTQEQRPTSATLERLPIYLRAVEALPAAHKIISSATLAAASGVTPATVRRDLWSVGVGGRRGVGWPATVLRDAIRSFVGAAEHEHRLAIAGAGNIGAALAGYESLVVNGFRVVALFDVDESRIGMTVAGVPVYDVRDIEDVCSAGKVSLGVIATPAAAAQSVADAFVRGGARALLNFAPVHVETPLPTRSIDVLRELHVLAFLAKETSAT